MMSRSMWSRSGCSVSMTDTTMKTNQGHRRDAAVRRGFGRSMLNKVSRTSKRNLDRRVDKRRRREYRAEDALMV